MQTYRITPQGQSADDPISELVDSYVSWVLGIGQTVRGWIRSGERQLLAAEALELAFLAKELDLPHVPSAAMKLQVEAVVGSPVTQSRAMGELVRAVRELGVVPTLHRAAS